MWALGVKNTVHCVGVIQVPGYLYRRVPNAMLIQYSINEPGIPDQDLTATISATTSVATVPVTAAMLRCCDSDVPS